MLASELFAILSSIALAIWVSWAFWAASKQANKSTWPIALWWLWIGASGGLAASGSLMSFENFPPPVMRVIAVGLVLSLAFACSPWGARLASHFSLAALVGFHAYRIMPETLIWLAYRDGLAPVQMTFDGGNWDFVSALGAAVSFFLIKKNIRPKEIATIWSIGAIALLVKIVAVAILSMPTPIRQFDTEPANTFVAIFPYIWLPMIHVPVAIIGHIFVLRKLLK